MSQRLELTKQEHEYLSGLLSYKLESLKRELQQMEKTASLNLLREQNVDYDKNIRTQKEMVDVVQSMVGKLTRQP